MQPFVTPAGTGEEIVAGPTTNTVNVPGSATDGSMSAVTMQLGAGWAGPPPHVHEVVNHCWFVLAGAVTLTIEGASATYERGDCLWVPAGVPHGFSTADTAGATVLQVDTGRALDGYFRDLAASLPAGRPPDPAAVAAVMARHDTRPVTPTSEVDASRHAP